jgi:hypothetical protein
VAKILLEAGETYLTRAIQVPRVGYSLHYVAHIAWHSKDARQCGDNEADVHKEWKVSGGVRDGSTRAISKKLKSAIRVGPRRD